MTTESSGPTLQMPAGTKTVLTTAGGGTVFAMLAVVRWDVPIWGAAGAFVAAVVGALLWWQRPAARVRRETGIRGWLGIREWTGRASAYAMLRHHCTPLQTLARLVGWGTTRRRGRSRVSAHGARVGRVVSGSILVRARQLFSAWSQGILVMGPAGSGKSSWLVSPIIDAPGPTYVSSTKTELFDLTGSERAQDGPVHVFNPASLGTVASTFGWNPVSGCEIPAIADARARALVRGGGGAASGQHAEFWAAKAAEIVRCLLLAAALENKGMSTVMDWALTAATGDSSATVSVLEQHPDVVPEGWIGTLQRNLGAAPGERSGYLAATVPAVTFVDNPVVADACSPDPAHELNLHRFLREGGTIYVIAGEDRRLAPLLTALTEAVFDAAKRKAACQSGGRLDPPLSLFLDEVANTTPVPLHTWAADSRGWGITVCAVVQDFAQLESRWGVSKAQTIKANLPTKVILPGVTNTKDLDALAYLAGKRTVRKTSETVSSNGGTRSRSRQRSWSKEPVVAGHTIYGLPRWHAYVLGLGPRAVIVRFRPGYKLAAAARRRQRRRSTAQSWEIVLPTAPAIDSVVTPLRRRETHRRAVPAEAGEPAKMST